LKLQTDIEITSFRSTLNNGLTVVTVEMPHIHTLEVAMFVRAGLRFENEKNNGISHFLEHMMFRGNRKYPDSISLNLQALLQNDSALQLDAGENRVGKKFSK